MLSDKCMLMIQKTHQHIYVTEATFGGPVMRQEELPVRLLA